MLWRSMPVRLALKAQHQARIHNTPFHGQHGCSRPENRRELVLEAGKCLWIKGIGAADQHQIRHFQLLLKQLFNRRGMVEAGIGEPLGFEGPWIRYHAPGRQGLTIHHRHHPMDAGTGANLGPLKGGQQGLR